MSRITKILLCPLSQGLALGCILLLLLSGCNKEKTANAAAADLAKAFETNAPEPVATTAAQTPSVSVAVPEKGQAKQLVQQAVSALQTNGYAVAFVTLRAAQTAPNITVDQYDAIEKARLAVEREMAAKAASGDPNAQQSLQAIQSLGH
jgi:hypothetical protein